ncbi:hypothetical protein COO91_00479 [Nostoc flagelliforme CCNUN1]|uniref:Uncharacterized protein n=1 Tax=Nostoc flagelliforme CCNUN1 TaxID=2038116 RepID=A0A2K8SH12_9NOSO|nr:hypothetical protein COO91_00479 [Nostoc flagelliforme CCNUN1]
MLKFIHISIEDDKVNIFIFLIQSVVDNYEKIKFEFLQFELASDRMNFTH